MATLANVVLVNLKYYAPITKLPSCPELLVSFGISAQNAAVLHVEATGISVNAQHPDS